LDIKLTILPDTQRLLWNELEAVPNNFVMYGGTALVLRLGHRQSVDFDFFSSDSFHPGKLYDSISFLRGSEKVQIDKNTLTCIVKRNNGTVKVSFFGGLSFGRVSPPDILEVPAVAIASLVDLAATKIYVIQDRAECKDYYDIAELLKDLSLGKMLSTAMAIFGKEFNPLLSLKALMFYQDGNLPKLRVETRRILENAARRVDLVNLPVVHLDNKRLI